jgi:hypothetical protein
MRVVLLLCLSCATAATAAGFEAAIAPKVEVQFGRIPDQPGGNVDSPPSSVPDRVRTGVRVELGVRLGHWFVGPLGELGFAADCSLETCYYYRVGAGARFHFSPGAARDVWMGLGAAWELLGYKTRGTPGIAETQHGPSGVLQAGIDFAWEGIRVGPFLGVSAGAYHLAGRDTAHGAVAAGILFLL